MMTGDDDDSFYDSGNVRDMRGHNNPPEEDEGDQNAAYNAKIEELMKLTPEELIERADKRLLVDLVAKMEAGYASHQELAILNTYLKNKGMVFPPRDPQNGANSDGGQGGTSDGKASLPTYSTPEYAAEDD